MIELIPDLPNNVVGFRAVGKVTREDYEQRLMPAIDRVLETQPKVRLLYVLGPEFSGYSGGAMWEDGKVGMQHLTRWERIALVADHAWVRHAVNVFGYLIPGQVKAFEPGEEAEAKAWLSS
jgi:SpoIIAA-like